MVKIASILSDTSNPVQEPVKAQLVTVIDDLLAADRILAEVAVEEAQATPVQNDIWRTPVQKHLAIARNEMEAARQQAEADCPREAIQHYKYAWTNAQLALKYAQCNLPELPENF